MVIFRPNLAYTYQFNRKIAEKVPKPLKNRSFCVIFSPFSSNFRGGGSPSARGGGGVAEKLRGPSPHAHVCMNLNLIHVMPHASALHVSFSYVCSKCLYVYL